MKVIITGGGGFLGAQLCQKLLERGELTGPSGAPERIQEIVLLDAVFHQPSQREVLLEAINNAVLTAAREAVGPARDLRVEIDPISGKITAYAKLTVVEKAQNKHDEISFTLARKFKEDVQLGEDLEVPVTPKGFGRIAAQTAKQAMMQRIRQAEDLPVRQIIGDISHRDTVFSAVGSDAATSIFHLASMVSGECEERFDDALRVNLDGGRNVFEAARAAAGRPRVVFASSIACFGGEAMQNPNTDRTKLTPQTTYGMTKVMCELLINDHSRKGHFDGRSARLPTVIVRPGKPNAAASSWASGMFREPLNGETCLLPIRRDQCHPMTGYRTVIESLIALHEIPAGKLSEDRAIGLPAHCVTPQLAESVIREIAQERGLKIGAIVDAFDARIQGIVSNWAVAVDGARAIALGLPQPPPLKQIVEQYLEDFGIS